MPAVGDLLQRARFGYFADDNTLRARIVPAGAPVAVWRAVEGDEVCVYGAVAAMGVPADAEQVLLRCTLAVPGAAAGEPARWHYVVETDVLPAMEDEFNAWYTGEHLPGLAAVPGTVAASRWVRVGNGPRYTACYDLATRETLGSPPWLAVRATAWSDRVRPAFRQTRRSLYRAVAR